MLHLLFVKINQYPNIIAGILIGSGYFYVFNTNLLLGGVSVVA